MLERKEMRYDPAVYGELRAQFLRNIGLTLTTSDEIVKDEEKKRQEILQDIKNGKLVIVKK
jgi:hypothetical protein